MFKNSKTFPTLHIPARIKGTLLNLDLDKRTIIKLSRHTVIFFGIRNVLFLIKKLKIKKLKKKNRGQGVLKTKTVQNNIEDTNRTATLNLETIKNQYMVYDTITDF